MINAGKGRTRIGRVGDDQGFLQRIINAQSDANR
jgi:hypothetical protein